MKPYIYALLILVCMLITGIPACAQLPTLSKQTIRAIRLGEETVLLATPGRIVDKSFITALSPTFRHEWLDLSAKIQITQSLSQNRANLPGNAAEAKSPLTAASGLASSFRQTIRYQENLSLLHNQLNQTLYNWGRLLDETQSLGYTQLAGVKGLGIQSATLTINGETALIQDTPGHGFTIYPDEIYTNATVVKAVMESSEHLPEILSQDKPENIAGWFYLQTNFKNAFDEFEAAQEAYRSLQKHGGLFAGLQNYHARHTEKGHLILRNYNYAAANLSLHAAKMLQFMSVHKELFPGAIVSYKQIMKLHNENSGTPKNFQNFWNQALIPVI